IEMQNDTEWTKRYYSDAARAKIEERKHLWSPELQAQVEKQWAELIRDVEAALGEDPAGDKAQALAERWRKLVEGFTGGDPEITAGLKALYADRKNWPAPAQESMKPFRRSHSDEVQAFISKAMAA